MFLLVLLFIVVPILELWVLLQVGQAIGVLPTIALLILDSILGSWLLRHQGRQAWRAFNEALGARRVPARETADGALIIFGGTLLITPGFISDILGLILLLPPTRALVRRILLRRGVAAGAASFGPAGTATAHGFQWVANRRRPAAYDVDTTATEVADDPPPRPALPDPPSPA
jgi:UPF0716 protein FxsA